MVKDNETVIQEFNDVVNMTSDELEAWLKEEHSESSGWSKDDGSGETVGHESGRKIIDILNRNPSKDPEKYEDDDLAHMRKVVSYCKLVICVHQQGYSKEMLIVILEISLPYPYLGEEISKKRYSNISKR
ncbi:hypothetical protein G7Y79_00017g043400 [Physcia stellaris]|nr:hypothetical protein G7Y79_00017g043400 [Physcia stellaris]